MQTEIEKSFAAHQEHFSHVLPDVEARSNGQVCCKRAAKHRFEHVLCQVRPIYCPLTGFATKIGGFKKAELFNVFNIKDIGM